MRPEKSEVTYTETYEWVLDHKFLKGQTDNESHGEKSISYGTYDPNVDGYPFWIFSSTGTYIYLVPGRWDARTRTLEWKNPPDSDLAYVTRVVFTDDRTRRWTVLVKDWKGTVLVQQEGSAVRRRD